MKTIDEIGLDIAFLPKNMTGELQVLDLVVNGPLKANIRKNRACVLYNSFQDYKVDRAEDSMLPLEQRKNLDFDPPKPTLIGGLKDIFQLFAEGFTEMSFKECITRTFIKTGTLPINYAEPTQPPIFTIYKKEEQNGFMSVVPAGTLDMSEENIIPIINEERAQNEVVNVDELERLILYFYAYKNDLLDEEDDDDDDE